MREHLILGPRCMDRPIMCSLRENLAVHCRLCAEPDNVLCEHFEYAILLPLVIICWYCLGVILKLKP